MERQYSLLSLNLLLKECITKHGLGYLRENREIHSFEMETNLLEILSTNNENEFSESVVNMGRKVEIKEESNEKIVKQKLEKFPPKCFLIDSLNAKWEIYLSWLGHIFPVFNLNDQSCKLELPSTNNQFLWIRILNWEFNLFLKNFMIFFQY